MPETLFEVRWPDDSRETCYSPSTIIAAHLETERAYSIETFVAACRKGLNAASERVREVSGGLGCLRAKAQLAAIEAKADTFGKTEIVRIETIGTPATQRHVRHG